MIKKLLSVSLFSLLVVIPTISQAQTPDTPITLNMTLSKADKIWKALRKLPVEEVEELMAEIRQQVMVQTTPKAVPVPKAELVPNANSSTEDKKDASPSNPPN